MKKVLISALAIILMFSLVACSSNKLADSFKEDEVVAKAKNVVETINTKDFDAVAAMEREDLQDQLGADKLKSALEAPLEDAGAFKEYKTVVTYGMKDKSADEDYAVCILVCKYENATHKFTLSFDKDLKIVGLYMN